MTIRTSSARAALVACIASVPFALEAFNADAVAQAPTSGGSPSKATPRAKTPYQATIAADSTLVRSAPSIESGYPFGNLGKGVTVTVVEEQVGWVGIQLTGDAFNGWFGFVQAGPGVTLAADGASLKVSSRAQISAPNADEQWNPDRSWKAIGFLVAGDEAKVLGEVKGQRDTFYKVLLTAKSVGWVNAGALAPVAVATPASETAGNVEKKPDASQPSTTRGGATTTSTDSSAQADAPATNPVDPDPTQDGGQPLAEGQTNAHDGKPANTAESRAQAVEKVRRVRFLDIDAVWQRVAKEPVETAELVQLRERFLALAEDTATPRGEAAAATRRAEQIAVRVDVQNSLLEIAQIRQRANAKVEGVANLELAMKTRQPWDAVGRLNASSIYNGDRLPLLYRLQDQGTGQTIAYILPTAEFDLPSMLGLLIGVKGPIRYDESLRLNTITPTQVGPLSAKDINPSSSAPTPNTVPASKTATGSEGKTDSVK